MRRGRPIDHATYRAFLDHAAQLLDEHADVLDQINVFPVPDADTGTNLSGTARAAADAAAHAADAEVASAASRAALRAAQGNAGTILSQVLAAFGQEFDRRGELDDAGIVAALRRASELVQRAIAEPVEGTMLTAVRAAADAAATAEHDVLGQLVRAVGDAVDRTPEQLDVLREAGVVDAGAHGFEVLCHALRTVVTGTPAAIPDRGARPTVARGDDQPAAPGPRWEVQYVVSGVGAAAADALREDLAGIGESVGVVRGDGVLRVHVHSADTEAAVAAGEAVGRVDQVTVADLHAQVADGGG